MPHYLRAGGYTTWIVIVVGLVLLIAAVRFLITASPRRLAFLRAMSVAYVLFILGGVATNFTSVFYNVVRGHPEGTPIDLDALLWGFGEALTPAGMGFSILGLIWLLIAIGVRRAHDPEV
jgi:hypothetical protein